MMPSTLWQVVNNLFQTCYNKLGTSSANTTCWKLVNRLVTTCLQTCNNLCVFFACTQPKTRKLQQVCWYLARNLWQQADNRMRSDGLPQLVDDKSVANCQQTCCKLIVKTYPQACCKLFQQVYQWQVATSLILTNRLKRYEIDKFVAAC